MRGAKTARMGATMRRLLPVLLALALAAPARAAPSCPVPPEVLEAARPLPHAARAVAEGWLPVLVLGSASVTGPGASDPAQSWPARLQAHLAAAFPAARVEVTVRGGRGVTVQDHLGILRADPATRAPALVVWQAGTVEAARRADPTEMAEALQSGLDRLRRRGADAVLVDMQWSRFLRANADVEPYRDKLRQAAGGAGAPLFRRWEVMEGWADAGVVDLERTPAPQRTAAQDRLNDCLARSLAALVVEGVREATAPAPR